MTYRDLLRKLQNTDDMRLDDDVTVYIEGADEYYPAFSITEAGDDQDVLIEDHLIIVIP